MHRGHGRLEGRVGNQPLMPVKEGCQRNICVQSHLAWASVHRRVGWGFPGKGKHPWSGHMLVEGATPATSLSLALGHYFLRPAWGDTKVPRSQGPNNIGFFGQNDSSIS